MLISIFLIIASVVVLFVIVVAIQSPDFRIERSAALAVPASVVFALVNEPSLNRPGANNQ